MYRRALPLLLTAVLLLSGCVAGQKNMPKKTDEKEMTGQSSDMSGEGIMYMDTTDHGKCHISGGRLLLGHGTPDAVHPRRH